MHVCSYSVLTGLRHKTPGLGTKHWTAKGQQGLHSPPPPVFKSSRDTRWPSSSERLSAWRWSFLPCRFCDFSVCIKAVPLTPRLRWWNVFYPVLTSVTSFWWTPNLLCGQFNVYQSLCVCACSVAADSETPWNARRFHPWNFPGKNTGMGCHFLPQGIFPTQELDLCLLCLLHRRADLYHHATWEA